MWLRRWSAVACAIPTTTGRSREYADDRDGGETGALVEWIGAREAAVVADRRAAGAAAAEGRPARLRRRTASPRHPALPGPGARAAGHADDGLDEGRLRRSSRGSRRARRAYERPASPGMPGSFGTPPAVLEVYPHATFTLLWWRRLAGGSRPLPRLAPKGSRLGTRQRIEILEAEGVEWRYYYDHDSLDALAAALTAWRYLAGPGLQRRRRRAHLAARRGSRARAHPRAPRRRTGSANRARAVMQDTPWGIVLRDD